MSEFVFNIFYSSSSLLRDKEKARRAGFKRICSFDFKLVVFGYQGDIYFIPLSDIL